MTIDSVKNLVVNIPSLTSNEVFLPGQLIIPSSGVKALVIFAHGSGSGRKSPRNQHVAKALNGFGLATLLVDLLTPEEQESDIKSQKIANKIPGLVLNKFNIGLLSNRLVSITEWTINIVPEINDLPIGYFGASTGAAAAIEASILFDKVFAIVSRGGRPDLADPDSIQNVKASTLLIVGSKDSKVVIDLNKKAFKQLRNAKSKDLVMIPNAGHLFKEDNAIEQVADVATKWLLTELR
jgi:putative phosphoribosyl transferase